MTVPRREGSNARCHNATSRDPGKQSVTQEADQTCPRCAGIGYFAGPAKQSCSDCAGTGQQPAS